MASPVATSFTCAQALRGAWMTQASATKLPSRAPLAPRRLESCARPSPPRPTPLHPKQTPLGCRPPLPSYVTPTSVRSSPDSNPGTVSIDTLAVGDGAVGTWRGAEEAFMSDLQETAREMQQCLSLVDSVGHGFVYLGSSRVPPHHEFFQHSKELSRQVALRFSSATWSGIGPGLMEAVCQGAAQAGTRVAGFKVVMEATQGPTDMYKHPHLPPDSYLVCRSLIARKQGLVWAGSRSVSGDRAGFVALPGGVGTLDELLDLLAVRQLSLDRSKHPVPFLVMNYGGCYDGLLACFKDMERFSLVREGELDPLWCVCRTNEEALHALDKFYGN